MSSDLSELRAETRGRMFQARRSRCAMAQRHRVWHILGNAQPCSYNGINQKEEGKVI